MTTVGVGMREILIKAGRQYRVFYIAKFADAVYVLHAFIKKTEQTAPRDIDLAKQRLSLIDR